MVVVLVYGDAPEPATLILHGNNGRTWLSIADGPRQRSDTKLSAEIKQILEKASVSISQVGYRKDGLDYKENIDFKVE